MLMAAPLTVSAAVAREEGGDFAADAANERGAVARAEQIDLDVQQAASALSRQVRRVHVFIGHEGEASPDVGEQVAAEECSPGRRAPRKTVLRKCRSGQSDGGEATW
jgi:hypothetical protein